MFLNISASSIRPWQISCQGDFPQSTSLCRIIPNTSPTPALVKLGIRQLRGNRVARAHTLLRMRPLQNTMLKCMLESSCSTRLLSMLGSSSIQARLRQIQFVSPTWPSSQLCFPSLTIGDPQNKFMLLWMLAKHASGSENSR
jgi:hypothetical protein